jgi:hypothetical protein
MTVYGSFAGASILELLGWGKVVDPDDRHYRIELADVDELAVYRPSLFGEKKMLSMSIEHLEVTTWTRQTTTGGGFIGGGFGITGALLGIAQARIMNALTRETHEDTVLGAFLTLPNGTQRHAAFGFRKLDESDLRDTLATTVHDWADGYVQATLSSLTPRAPAESDLQATYAKIDQMRERAMLDPTQALILCSPASSPFVAAVLQSLRSGKTTPAEAQQLRSKIDELHRARRLTDNQAQEIRQLLDPISSPRPRTPTSETRLRQIELLAELRSTGALTEQEFQAEKSRLLGTRTDH